MSNYYFILEDMGLIEEVSFCDQWNDEKSLKLLMLWQNYDDKFVL